MTTFNRHLFALTGILFLPLQLCLAQAPSGLITFSFDNVTAPVWDLSGDLTFEQSMLGVGGQPSPLAFSLNVTQDVRGVLTGSGGALVTVGNDVVGGTYTLRGNVHGGGNSPIKASINVKLSGRDFVAGVETDFKINVHYNLVASSEERAFNGTASGSANFSQLSSGRVKSDVSVPVPGTMDGSWVAQLNILPLQKLGGSGTIILSSGKMLPTQLKGSYSTNTALANVKLTGINEAKGISVNIKFISSAEGIELQSLKGKILGQNVQE